MTVNTLDQTPAWKARVNAAVQAMGLAINADDAANQLMRNRFPVAQWSPEAAASDGELRDALQALPISQTAAAEQAARPGVHAANRHLIGTHPAAFLAGLGAMPFDQLPPQQRVKMWRSYELHGSAHGPQAKGDANLPAPVSRTPDKLPTPAEMPAAFHGLSGMKMLEAARTVAAADKAKAAIKAHEAGQGVPLSSMQLHAARQAVVKGLGGSVGR